MRERGNERKKRNMQQIIASRVLVMNLIVIKRSVVKCPRANFFADMIIKRLSNVQSKLQRD